MVVLKSKYVEYVEYVTIVRKFKLIAPIVLITSNNLSLERECGYLYAISTKYYKMDGVEDNKKLSAQSISAAGVKKSSKVEVVSTPNTTMVGYKYVILICLCIYHNNTHIKLYVFTSIVLINKQLSTGIHTSSFPWSGSSQHNFGLGLGASDFGLNGPQLSNMLVTPITGRGYGLSSNQSGFGYGPLRGPDGGPNVASSHAAVQAANKSNINFSDGLPTDSLEVSALAAASRFGGGHSFVPSTFPIEVSCSCYL